MRQALCAHCGQPLAGDKVAYRSKNYHANCLEQHKSVLIASAKAKDTKKAVSLQATFDPDLDRLTKYILLHFQLDSLTPLLSKQINDFHKQRGYSYRDIYLTLRYFYEMCPPPDEEERAPTIGIVPYIYNEAMNFWKLAEEANEYNKNITIHESTVTIRHETKPAPLYCPFRMEDV